MFVNKPLKAKYFPFLFQTISIAIGIDIKHFIVRLHNKNIISKFCKNNYI